MRSHLVALEAFADHPPSFLAYPQADAVLRTLITLSASVNRLRGADPVQAQLLVNLEAALGSAVGAATSLAHGLLPPQG